VYYSRLQPFPAIWGTFWLTILILINGFDGFWNFTASGFLRPCSAAGFLEDFWWISRGFLDQEFENPLENPAVCSVSVDFVEFSELQDLELPLLSDPTSATLPLNPAFTADHTPLAAVCIPFVTAHVHLPLIFFTLYLYA